MAIEEKVIQPESVTNAEQPVADTPSQAQPPIEAIKKQYEEQITKLQKKLSDNDSEWSNKFSNLKSKLDDLDKAKESARKKSLADQGQWKTLWEEANKTAQEKDQKISTLSQQLEDMKTSNELASIKQTALSEIANQGAKAPNQLLRLIEDKIKKDANGKLVILDGGVEQDFSNYITTLKSPGSDWDHHFLPSNKSGMGAKPSPVANTSSGTVNPWMTGNITKQIIMEDKDPNLAAVLKKEAQK